MDFWNDHKDLEGQHAFLGASNFHWINWSDEEFQSKYYSQYANVAGTAIHELAHNCIISRTRLCKHDKNLVKLALFKAYVPPDGFDSEELLENLIPFVNDAIGFHMSSEILLYYSKFCFGTTDAISYSESEKMVRIHDLKTGTSPAHIEQLLLYLALFCLEYHKDPEYLKTELRIYQNVNVLIYNPLPGEVRKYMELIQTRSSTIISYLEREGK